MESAKRSKLSPLPLAVYLCKVECFLFLTILLSGLFLSSVDTHAKSINAHTYAEIRSNVAINEVTSMSINPAQLLEHTNQGYKGSTQGQAARFQAAGTPNSSVTISFTNGNISGNGTSMKIHNFSHNVGKTPAFNKTGNLDFHVGAEVNINSQHGDTTPDSTYSVTINYQ